MNEEEMQISIPAAGTIVGTSVGALTYLLLSESGEATATLTGKSCKIVGYLAGKGTEYVAGSAVGQTVRIVTSEFGDLFLVPCIRKGSRTTAVVVAGVAGATASLLTAAAVHGGRYISRKVMEYISTRTQSAADCSGEFTVVDHDEGGEFVCVERRASDRSHSSDSDPVVGVADADADADARADASTETVSAPETFNPADI
jgi:hypothetical protein